MNEFLSWGILGTFAGSVAITATITQFCKDFIKIPTQWLSYIIAVIILCGATAVTSGFADLSSWTLIPINAVIVSLAANGGHAVVKRVMDTSKSAE